MMPAYIAHITPRDGVVRRLLADAVKAAPVNGALIAARMSELTGAHVSEHMLHAWRAPSREAWRFPHEDVAAINDWHKMAADALSAWENRA